MDLTANPDFQKVFFAVQCDCGTAGLLSVEVAPDKTVGGDEAGGAGAGA